MTRELPNDASSDYGTVFDYIIAGHVYFENLADQVKRLKEEGKFTGRNEDKDYRKHLTGIIKRGDPRENSEMFKEAKQQEIDEVMSRGTIRTVKVENIPRNANVLGGRFVCTKNNVGTDHDKAKAC